jgi:Uma2 family endonuclease
MGEPARKLDEHFTIPTFEETWKKLELLPAGITGEILEPGVISTMPRPAARHRRAAGNLYRALGPMDEGDDGAGWWIDQEPDVRFGDRTAVPDIAGWRVDRCPDPPEGSPIIVCPDFCCEVLSPSTFRKDRKKKLPLYAQHGVEWVWIVVPEFYLVEVYQSINGRPTLTEVAEENDRMRLPPFELEIDFSRLWIPSKTIEFPLEPDPSQRI